jgi:NitT/TauT family transport system substrate-binding protein
MLGRDSSLCEAVTGGILEALAFTLTNPQGSLDIFQKEMPEMALNPSAKEFARIGLGMWHHGVDRPEPCEHGLGCHSVRRPPHRSDAVGLCVAKQL